MSDIPADELGQAPENAEEIVDASEPSETPEDASDASEPPEDAADASESPGEPSKKESRLRSRLRPPAFSAPMRWSLTVFLFLSAVFGLTSLSLLIGTQNFYLSRLLSYYNHPTIFALNCLPVLLLMLLLYFVTNRAWASYLISSLLLSTMGFVSYFKIVLRGDPLVAEDFTTIGEGVGIVGQYELEIPSWLFRTVFLIVAGTLILMRYARGRVPKRRRWIRLIAIVLVVAMAFGAWSLWYTDENIYELAVNEDGFNVWRETDKYASKGFLYSFLHSISRFLPTEPEGYSEAAAQEMLTGYTDADIPEDQKINFVVTMLESYTDLSKFDTINFTADPYTEFHALQEESYCGVMISDITGGGTVNTERSFLTGFSYPQPSYNTQTNSYIHYFANQGYFTEGGHPGYEWFYSRQKVNQRLGFDRYYFLEGYYSYKCTPDNSIDEYLGDEAFFAERSATYHSYDGDAPYFSFNVSYQGHSPYDNDVLNGTEYVSHEGLSDGAYNTVNNYLNSVADTGKQISAFVDSFRDDEEPVVLMFFGDHKPALGAGNSYYEEMGIPTMEWAPMGFYNVYSTPYLIWANDAAKEILGQDFVGEGPTVSPCYLMSVLFDVCGWEDIGPAWLQYQADCRREIPVIHRNRMYLHLEPTWTFDSTLTDRQAEVLYDYRIVEYYVRRIVPETE